jgi:hypothetical protein
MRPMYFFSLDQQPMFSSLKRLATATTAIALMLVSAPSFAQNIYRPQDTTGAIASYEVLGVRLGMTESDAVAAIRQRFPAGTQDANGRVINLRVSDYQLTSPRTQARVRAGVRFDLGPELPPGRSSGASNFNFVKLLVHEGRVWAVWRDDQGARYPYEQTVAEVQAKYRGAVPIPSAFMLVNGGSISREPGPPAIDGLQLYAGQCISPPLASSSSGDKISLDPACNKAFHWSYQPRIEGGVKVMASGHVQLVDLEQGRSFMRFLASASGNMPGDKPRTSDAKL